MGRNCWECDRLRMYSADPGYSEYTPGTELSLSCAKDHWRFNAYDTSEKQAREYFRTADRCPDFEAVR